MGRKPEYGSQAQTAAERAKRKRDKKRQARAAQAVEAYSVQIEYQSQPGLTVIAGTTYDLSQMTGPQITGFFKAVEERKGLDAEHWYFLTGQSATIVGSTTIALNAARVEWGIEVPGPLDAIRPEPKPDKAPPCDPRDWPWTPQLQLQGGKGGGRVLRGVPFRESGKRVVRKVEAVRAANKGRRIELTDEIKRQYEKEDPK